MDIYTAFGILKSLGDIYNINLAGRPVGPQNVATTCPHGGTVTITGTTGYAQDVEITTVDLSYQMIDCQTSIHTNDNIDITLKLTGTITEKGSFSSDYKALNYQSDFLKIMASIYVPGYKPENVDEICEFSATGTTNNVSGYICKRYFSW